MPGLQALSFWASRGDFEPGWWLPKPVPAALPAVVSAPAEACYRCGSMITLPVVLRSMMSRKARALSASA
ncbi:DUF5360 family protein [Deinococcus sp.]|uniref:DUF5360 family protein n=1 Tax=Deinococcus sp. TaxID=47478 RepID=UPI003C7CDBCC